MWRGRGPRLMEPAGVSQWWAWCVRACVHACVHACMHVSEALLLAFPSSSKSVLCLVGLFPLSLLPQESRV